MNRTLFETLGAIAGIGGIALGVFLLLFRDVIRRNIFPNLTREQAYKIIRLVLILTFLIALAGIGAWVWSNKPAQEVDQVGGQTSSEPGQFRRVYYEGFSTGHLDAADLSEKLGSIWLGGKRGDWEGRFAEGVHILCNVTGNATASFTNRLRY